jgi:Uma2 family endonuclease
MVLQLVRHQFTVKQFHQMAESGILSENERVELIRGEMIDMSPIGTRHSGCVLFLSNLLILLLGGRALQQFEIKRGTKMVNFKDGKKRK